MYNKALAWQNEHYTADPTFMFSDTKMVNLLPQWKAERVWLKEAPSQSLQQALKNLESSFRNFFAKRSDFPQGFKIEQQNNRLFLPKVGWIRYRNSQEILGVAKNITASQKCGKCTPPSKPRARMH